MNDHKNTRYLAWPLAVLLSLVSMQALAVFDPLEKYYGEDDRGEFENYDDSQDKPWEESRLGKLALPDDATLLEVKIDRLPPGMTLYLDEDSLSLDGNDGVLRMWLVVKSASGAYNATFEGFRCETREYKVYAYGNPRRAQKVRRAPKAAWKTLRGGGRLNYRKELYGTLLCDGKGPQKVEDIIATLKGYRDYLHPGVSDQSGF